MLFRSVALLLLALSIYRVYQQTRRPISDYLSELTGPKYTDCGSYEVGIDGWEKQQDQVLDCAVTAARKPAPFVFIEIDHEIDSTVYTGWVRKKNGVLLRYAYDSQPCGGPGCREIFSTKPCPSPNLHIKDGRVRFLCAKPE